MTKNVRRKVGVERMLGVVLAAVLLIAMILVPVTTRAADGYTENAATKSITVDETASVETGETLEIDASVSSQGNGYDTAEWEGWYIGTKWIVLYTDSDNEAGETGVYSVTDNGITADFVFYEPGIYQVKSTVTLNGENYDSYCTVTVTGESIDVAHRYYGDVDFDGDVTVKDALSILQYYVSLVDLSDDAVSIADVNTDGTVDVSDALEALRIYVNLSETENYVNYNFAKENENQYDLTVHVNPNKADLIQVSLYDIETGESIEPNWEQGGYYCLYNVQAGEKVYLRVTLAEHAESTSIYALDVDYFAKYNLTITPNKYEDDAQWQLEKTLKTKWCILDNEDYVIDGIYSIVMPETDLQLYYGAGLSY